jgi:hypothetical protein
VSGYPEKPYSISMKFSIDELAAFAVALDRIASGTAESLGIDTIWEKWTDPSRAKAGNGKGLGKKRLSVVPVMKRGDNSGWGVNIHFHCGLPSDTKDSRGIFKTCKRDGQGIRYGITVNFGIYEAMAAAANILSLAVYLTGIDRQCRIRRFNESMRQQELRAERKPAAVTGIGMRLHQNARSDGRANSSVEPYHAFEEDSEGYKDRYNANSASPRPDAARSAQSSLSRAHVH